MSGIANSVLSDIAAAKVQYTPSASSTPAPVAVSAAQSPSPSSSVLSDIQLARSGKIAASTPPKQEPSAAADIASGLVTGVGAQTLGAPMDLAIGTIDAVAGAGRDIASKAAHPIDTLTGMVPVYGEEINPGGGQRSTERSKEIAQTPLISNAPGGSQWWNSTLGEAGLPTTETVQPTTTVGRVLQQGSRAAGAFAAPGLAGKLATATDLPRVGEALSSLSPGNLPANAAIGAGAGAAGELASEAVPDQYTPAARTIGETVGGIGGGLAGGVLGVGNLARNALPPMTTASREAAAGNAAVRTLEHNASDPDAAFQALQDRVTADNLETVPGSKPTTAEAAADPGMLALQRVRERQEPTLGAAVTAQDIANNAKQHEFIQGMAPKGTDVTPAQAAVKQHLDNIDTWGQIDLENARAAVAGGHAATGAALSAADTAAREQLEKSTGAFGGQEALGTPEERAAATAAYGAAMRDPAQEAYVAERARLKDLRAAVDPSGTMGLRPEPIKAAVDDIENTFKPESGAMYSGAEKHLYDTARSWGNTIPIEDAFQFRANINGRLKHALDHSPQEEKRLVMLKQGVDQAISDAVGDTHVAEQAGTINQGAPPIENRISGLAENPAVGPSFAQDVARAYQANPAALRAARGDPTGRSILETAERARGSVPEGTVPAEGGEGGNPNGGLRGGPGSEGVPQEPGETAPATITPLTEEARQLFAQWNSEYGDMMRTFQGETAGKLHPVGKMLQKGGPFESYRLADAEVPSLFVDADPKTARLGVQRFVAATPPEAHEALDNAFAFSLRRAAQDPTTGELNFAKYNTWLKNHEGALSERPELLDKFNTAAKAQQLLNGIRDDLAAFQKTYADALKTAEKGAVNDHLNARNAFTKSVAGMFMGDDVDKAIGRYFKPVPNRTQNAQALMKLVAGNKAAIEGVQRAAIDHIVDTYASGVPIARSSLGSFKAQRLQDFIAANHGVLDTLFPNGLSKNFDALAEDLKRSQMVPNAKLKGGSDTMQLQNAAKQHEVGHGDAFGTAALGIGVEKLGEKLAGVYGLALAVPVVRNWLKDQAASHQISTNNILDQMLLNPKYALEQRAAYPSKTSAVGRPSIIRRFGARVMQSAAQAARARDLTGGAQPTQRASGGRLDHRSLSVADQGRHFADLLEAARKRHYANGGSIHAMSVEEQGAHLADMIEKRRKEISAQDVANVI